MAYGYYTECLFPKYRYRPTLRTKISVVPATCSIRTRPVFVFGYKILPTPNKKTFSWRTVSFHCFICNQHMNIFSVSYLTMMNTIISSWFLCHPRYKAVTAVCPYLTLQLRGNNLELKISIAVLRLTGYFLTTLLKTLMLYVQKLLHNFVFV